MARLAVLHTVYLLAGRFKTLLQAELPEVDTFHMLDESLLQDLIRHGPQTDITRRVVGLAKLAADAGADLMVFTCSSTSPAIDVARKEIDVPIMKIDDPMADHAVQAGQRIGIVCTTPSTRGPTEALIREHATRRGQHVDVEVCLVAGAFDALMAGRQEEHDRLVIDAARVLATENDVVVLAQASLAHLQKTLTPIVEVPILASTPLCVEAVARHFRESE